MSRRLPALLLTIELLTNRYDWNSGNLETNSSVFPKKGVILLYMQTICIYEKDT